MGDPWPDRIIDLTAREKADLIRRDVHRYYTQVRAERVEEAFAELRGRTDRLARSTGRLTWRGRLRELLSAKRWRCRG